MIYDKGLSNNVANAYFFTSLNIAYEMLSHANAEQLDFLKITASQQDLLCSKDIILENSITFADNDKTNAAFNLTASKNQNATVIAYNDKCLLGTQRLELTSPAHELRHAIDFWEEQKEPSLKFDRLKRPLYPIVADMFSSNKTYMNNSIIYQEELVAYDFGYRFGGWGKDIDYPQKKISPIEKLKEIFIEGYPSKKTTHNIWLNVVEELKLTPNPLFEGQPYTIGTTIDSYIKAGKLER